MFIYKSFSYLYIFYDRIYGRFSLDKTVKKNLFVTIKTWKMKRSCLLYVSDLLIRLPDLKIRCNLLIYNFLIMKRKKSIGGVIYLPVSS